jgi:hypothetical protein
MELKRTMFGRLPVGKFVLCSRLQQADNDLRHLP